MQSKNSNTEDDQDPVDSFKQLFYPEFPPGASPEDFLAHYDPLFEELRKIDLIQYEEFTKSALYNPQAKNKFDDLENTIQFIVDELNYLCTFCHRKELRAKICLELSQYKKNFKNVPIGKKPIEISKWQNSFLKQQFVLQSVEESLRPKITNILDKVYVEHKRIPNYYLLFLTNPELFIRLYEFEQKLIFDSSSDKTSLPLVHKFYLGVIVTFLLFKAASTYGSGYLWNFMVGKFLKYGGDPKWIETGLDELPELLRKMSQASYQMAYDFNINVLEHICFEIGKIVEDSAILQGFYILGYFQFLACVSLAFGLVAESGEYEKMYLPEVACLKPSYESFETMNKVSSKEARYENEMAREFEEMYSWQKDSEKQNYKRVQLQLQQKKSTTSKKAISEKGVSSKAIPSEPVLPSKSEMSVSSQLMITIEQEEMIKKLGSCRTMEYIKKVFAKFVEFDQRRSLVEFKRKGEKKTRVSNSGNEEESNQSNSSGGEDEEFIYASEWNFESNTSGLMESTMSQSLYKKACELLKGLKSIQGQKSKNLKMYYQSLQNYMYEYISYVTLINQGLSQVEKNYVKLLTRSPFLFNERSFIKMKQDLEALEHAIALSSYAYSRYIEDK